MGREALHVLFQNMMELMSSLREGEWIPTAVMCMSNFRSIQGMQCDFSALDEHLVFYFCPFRMWTPASGH